MVQPSWKLSPKIKPKSNLASKSRINRGRLSPESKTNKDNEIENRVQDMERIVDQLKHFVFSMVVKRVGNGSSFG